MASNLLKKSRVDLNYLSWCHHSMWSFFHFHLRSSSGKMETHLVEMILRSWKKRFRKGHIYRIELIIRTQQPSAKWWRIIFQIPEQLKLLPALNFHHHNTTQRWLEPVMKNLFSSSFKVMELSSSWLNDINYLMTLETCFYLNWWPLCRGTEHECEAINECKRLGNYCTIKCWKFTTYLTGRI